MTLPTAFPVRRFLRLSGQVVRRCVLSLALGAGLAVAAAGCRTAPAGEQPPDPAGAAAAVSGGSEPAGPAEAATTNAAAQPAAAPAPAAGGPEPEPGADPQSYRIHAGDTLHVQVNGETDLSGDFKVATDGLVVYPLLGRLSVLGLTASTVESNLTAALGKDYLVNPKVFVQVRSSVMRRVIVFGEVKAPGVYELPLGERFTLLQVIAKAGGLTDIAATDRVRVVRRSGQVEETFKVNVTDLLQGRGAARDVDLQPNDVITVPQTLF